MKRAADALTALILETFRLNGRLLAAGDDLVRGLDLTSARWQVLGAIAVAPAALSVSQIGRAMGLTRQAVQRLVNDLAHEGLLRFAANPHHRRAKLVMMTPRGQAAYGAAMKRQAPWAHALTQGLEPQQLEKATVILKQLRQRLERDHSDEGD
jgi:DNA-binding MarR family transcriptional regulator